MRRPYTPTLLAGLQGNKRNANTWCLVLRIEAVAVITGLAIDIATFSARALMLMSPHTTKQVSYLARENLVVVVYP